MLSLCQAYILTLCVNATRIIISLWLYGAPIYGNWVTPERIHRIEGTVVYLFSLIIAYSVADRLTRQVGCPDGGVNRPASSRGGQDRLSSVISRLFIPFGWYVFFAVVIPLINGAAGQKGPGFTEHIAVVTAIALCAFVLCSSVTAFRYKRVDSINQRKEND